MKNRLSKHLDSSEKKLISDFFKVSWSPKMTYLLCNLLLERKGDSFRTGYYAINSFLHEEYPELMIAFAYRHESRQKAVKERKDQEAMDAMRELLMREKKDGDGRPDLT